MELYLQAILQLATKSCQEEWHSVQCDSTPLSCFSPLALQYYSGILSLLCSFPIFASKTQSESHSARAWQKSSKIRSHPKNSWPESPASCSSPTIVSCLLLPFLGRGAELVPTLLSVPHWAFPETTDKSLTSALAQGNQQSLFSGCRTQTLSQRICPTSCPAIFSVPQSCDPVRSD